MIKCFGGFGGLPVLTCQRRQAQAVQCRIRRVVNAQNGGDEW